MTRRFCDVCGRELTRNFVTDPLVRTDGLMVVRVMVGKKTASSLVWGDGDICQPCLVGIVKNGHDVDSGGEPVECI